jgi:hypothetical protein
MWLEAEIRLLISGLQVRVLPGSPLFPRNSFIDFNLSFRLKLASAYFLGLQIGVDLPRWLPVS